MSIQLTVRTWAKAQLLATTGLTVYPSPRADIPVEELAAGPALCMFSHHDRPADAAADSSRPHERIYTLAVDQQHVGRQEEDTTEALAIQVRQALLVHPMDLPQDVSYVTWGEQQWAGVETEKPLSGTVQLFSFHYLWRPEW